MTRAFRLGYRPWAPAPVRRNPITRNEYGSISHRPPFSWSAVYSVRPSGDSFTSCGLERPWLITSVRMTRWVPRSISIIRPANSQLANA